MIQPILRLALSSIVGLATAAVVGGQSKPLEIYWVDVEGGGATLIVTPAGESILIDAGEDLERDASRIFEVRLSRP